ncbi:MAG: ribonuclease III [Gaiellaceae bacterium]
MIAALPPELAEPVFTHTSWASERNDSYERLEFLGDSVLELAVAHALYAQHPDFSEGQLAKVRSHVVSRATCAEVARDLGLGQRLVEHAAPTQTEEELERLSVNRNVLAAVIEAALGALFLQHGFAAIEDAVVAAFSDQIEHALTSRVDQKTDLQELLARTGRQVTYVEISVEGPPHERRFTCAAIIDGEELGRGEGRTKKAAEQEAARGALAKLDAAGTS